MLISCMLKQIFDDPNNRLQDQERALAAGIRVNYRPMFADQPDSYDFKMRERYFSFWDQMPFSPEEAAQILTEGIIGGPDDLVVKDMFFEPIIENGVAKGLKVETKFVPRGEEDSYSSYTYLNSDREFDFTTGTCKNGDVRSDHLKEKGLGRVAVRNSLQLGHALGCPKIEISATRIGCLLWLQDDAYEVTHVNPDYTKNMLKRWSAIEAHCGDTVDTAAIRSAIESGDLKALAAQKIDIGDALASSPGGRHSHHDLCLQNGEIPLNRYLLFDNKIDCWQGRADMDNPAQRENLAKLLGGWTSESLKPTSALVQTSENILT